MKNLYPLFKEGFTSVNKQQKNLFKLTLIVTLLFTLPSVGISQACINTPVSTMELTQ